MATRPLRILAASAFVMMPLAANMSACASDPAMSSAARRLSKSMEVLISSIMAAGPSEKRAPHILFVVMAMVPLDLIPA